MNRSKSTNKKSKSAAWAAKITTVWQQTLQGIFKSGRLLIDAKKALGHGAFGKMIENELPFGPRTAERLMQVAADKRLTNPTRASVLPPSWGTLYALSRLDDAAFEKAVARRHIHAEMDRAEAEALAGGDYSLRVQVKQSTRRMRIHYAVEDDPPQARTQIHSERALAPRLDNSTPSGTVPLALQQLAVQDERINRLAIAIAAVEHLNPDEFAQFLAHFRLVKARNPEAA
jgi:Protein of unknown function (DUF3102)